MGLQFGICEVCGESHVKQASGDMSIHTTKAGTRCPGAHVPAEPLRPRRDAGRVVPSPPKRQPKTRSVDPEREAAFAAAQKRKRLLMPPTPDKFDRRIYAVGGVHTVSGGLPGTRRGH